MTTTHISRTQQRPTVRRLKKTCTLLTVIVALGGCDMLGIETPATQTAAVMADGKAVGAACRHAGRAIEDCYSLNPKARKAAVFDGWKEMNDYMTKNKIEVVQPQMSNPVKQASAAVEAPRADEATQLASRSNAGQSNASSDPARPRPKITAISEADIMSAKARAHAP
jgi:hypothetical protein